MPDKVKRVLVISYYWPPAGGIGVLRNLKLIKYFREFGWEPVVLVPENAHYPYEDQGNFKDIPENLEILKVKIWEPFAAFKLLSGRKKNDTLNNIVQVRSRKTALMDDLGIWIRGNFFIPDARSFWIKPSVKFLLEYLRKNPVDAIFTDGPPHTNTYIGCKVSQQLNIPWIADFQDPWTQVDYYKDMKIGRRADRKHKAMEQEVFRTARKISVASPTWKKDLESIGAKNVEVLYYGYDEADFANRPRTKSVETLVISHAGLLGIDRCPDLFLEKLADYVKQNPDAKIVLKLAGQVDYGVREKIQACGLELITEYLGTIPREAALNLVMESHVLLLPLNKQDNAQGRIPGKLYEYLRSYNKILAFGPEDSDVSKILAETNAGKCYDYNNADCISFIEQVIKHDSSSNNETDPEGIRKFSNLELTRLVSSWLNEVTSNE